MKCPLIKTRYEVEAKQYDEPLDCLEGGCAWWDSKANFNSETKQFEGQCCILTLSRLKVSGGINTHPF